MYCCVELGYSILFFLFYDGDILKLWFEYLEIIKLLIKIVMLIWKRSVLFFEVFICFELFLDIEIFFFYIF